MSVAQQKENKFIVVEYLIQSGVSPTDILDATVKNITDKGLKFGDKEITVEGKELEAFGKHVQTLSTELLFPGKKNSKQSLSNFLKCLSDYLKKSGRTLQDLGIQSSYVKEPLLKLENVVEIRQYLYKRLGIQETPQHKSPGRPKKETQESLL